MHKVFVYGSLKRGGVLNRVFGNFGYIKDVSVRGFDLYDLGAYPTVRESSEGIVHGELWDVTDRTLEELDWIEGMFRRVPVVIEEEPAWIYMLEESTEGCPLVENGVWEVQTKEEVTK